eukprot:GHVN01093962.1.p1 GENE.GHVN01093962.1~~GHVN01093962.1.p1  ORF type:complete len:357 (-),score=52.61 GHVN01093962.1:278-1276(-)
MTTIYFTLSFPESSPHSLDAETRSHLFSSHDKFYSLSQDERLYDFIKHNLVAQIKSKIVSEVIDGAKRGNALIYSEYNFSQPYEMMLMARERVAFVGRAAHHYPNVWHIDDMVGINDSYELASSLSVLNDHSYIADVKRSRVRMEPMVRIHQPSTLKKLGLQGGKVSAAWQSYRSIGLIKQLCLKAGINLKHQRTSYKKRRNILNIAQRLYVFVKRRQAHVSYAYRRNANAFAFKPIKKRQHPSYPLAPLARVMLRRGYQNMLVRAFGIYDRPVFEQPIECTGSSITEEPGLWSHLTEVCGEETKIRDESGADKVTETSWVSEMLGKDGGVR